MEFTIRDTLTKELEPTHLEVHNESALHKEVNIEFRMGTTPQQHLKTATLTVGPWGRISLQGNYCEQEI